MKLFEKFKTMFRRHEEPTEAEPIEETKPEVPKSKPLTMKELLIKEKTSYDLRAALNNVVPKQEEVETFEEFYPSEMPIQQPQTQQQHLQHQQEPQVVTTNNYYQQPQQQQFQRPQSTAMQRTEMKVHQMLGHGKTNQELGQIYGGGAYSKSLKNKIW